MENLVRGTLNESLNNHKHNCDGDRHNRNPMQYLIILDNQKATALRQGLWLLF